MLLFINILDVYEYLGAAFQYISCYSLSKGRWNLNLRMMRFNTSHVTLYLTAATGQKITVVFQYISCYSLSAKNWAMDHLECEFQYISCYSLSDYKIFKATYKKVSIHLMLLFIVTGDSLHL